MKRISAILLFAALAGCVSFQAKQTDMFTDEQGNIVTVTYGELKKKVRTTFVSPNTKKPYNMTTALAVEVSLPDGSSFSARQCYNPLPSGTMYISGNDKWLFRAMGLFCTVYRWNDRLNDYAEVFSGQICEGNTGEK